MQNVELTATSVEEQAGNEQPQRTHDGAPDRESILDALGVLTFYPDGAARAWLCHPKPSRMCATVEER